MEKRKMDVCVISDIHLGTFGCQAKEVLNYLRSIHNINIQSGSNKSGFTNSNTLAFIDSFQARTISTFSTLVVNPSACV